MTIQHGETVPAAAVEIAVGVVVVFMHLPWLICRAGVPDSTALFGGCRDYPSAIAVSWLTRKRCDYRSFSQPLNVLVLVV